MKLYCLEKLLKLKIDILDKNFKVVMDSKKADKNTLFFAINKGNEYVEEAVNKGAFVIYDVENKKLKNSFHVKNTIEFMQEFAKMYRQENKFKVIAITGSNGKTTVKDSLYSVLKNKGLKVYKTQGNYNNHIGLPFTILSANNNDEFLLLEMGMSNLGEIDLLASIAKPDYGIITNIGHSHLEYLKTRENVYKAKTELITHTKNKVYVPKEDEYLSKLKDNEKVILVEKKEIKTNLVGEHNKMNLSIVEKLCSDIKFDNLDFSNIELSSGRYEIIEGKNRYINDAYNASPLSMEYSLKTFSNMYNEDFKIICLGDMLELGEDEIKYHENLLEILEETNFDVLMLYGTRMKYLYNKIRKYHILKLANNINSKYSLNWYLDKEEIKKDIEKIVTDKKKTILIKASRGMKLEEIMEVK